MDGARWLLVRAGGCLLAVPAQQVRSLVGVGAEAASEGDGRQGAPDTDRATTTALAQRLGVEAELPGGVQVRVRGRDTSPGVRVRSVEEMIQGPELAPLPLLLRRALGEGAPFLGAILWRGRPVLVVDLARCID